MIDEKIVINLSRLPRLIVDCIEKLEYYNKINDDIMYYSTLDLLETTAKSYILNNKLSKEDYSAILKKYGGEI